MSSFENSPKGNEPSSNNPPESLEEMQSKVKRIIDANQVSLNRWLAIPQPEADSIKKEFKEALGIPVTEKVTMSVHASDVLLEGKSPEDMVMDVRIDSTDNPLKRYLRATYHRHDNPRAAVTGIHLKTFEKTEDGIKEQILDALKIPRDLYGDLKFRSSNSNDSFNQTFHNVNTKNGDVWLGNVVIDEDKKTVFKVTAIKKNIEKIVPKTLTLTTSMESLGIDGNFRDKEMRNVVKEAIKDNLPTVFDNRDIFITGIRKEGKIVITVEDKVEELTIGTMEYDPETERFTRISLDVKNVRTIEKK